MRLGAYGPLGKYRLLGYSFVLDSFGVRVPVFGPRLKVPSVVLFFLLAVTLGALLELPHPRPQAFGKLGDSLRPEQEQNYYQHYDQVSR